MDSQELREFVASYASELADLTFNSKPIINTLTMLASENLAAASSIAAAIERHILMCPPEHKLFALYLMDSIVKNVGPPYVSLFARNLPEVYVAVWEAAPPSAAALQKLLNTWKGLFPDAMLFAIASRVAQGRAQPLQMPSPGRLQPAAQPFVPAGLDPWQAAPQSFTSAQPYTGYGPPPSPPAAQYHTGAYAQPAPVQQQQQQQYYQAAPAHYAAAPAASAAPAAYYAPQQPQQQQQQHAAPVQQSHVGLVSGQYVQQAPQQQALQQQAPQQQAPQQQALQQQVPQQQAPQQQQAQQQQGALPLPGFLSSLYQAGLIQVPGGAIVAAAGDPLQGLSAEDLPLRGVDRAKMDFSPDRLKAKDSAVVRELLACSAALRPRHLDITFLHRRRSRAGAGRASQQWYVGLDDWVAGTAADTAAAPAFFEMQARAAALLACKEEVAQEAASVPADDAQPVCALSGERFETFWDDRAEEWRFRDAVRLDAAQAARYGLAEGVIVKVGCLSEGGAGDALLRGEEQPGSIAAAGEAAQQVAADLAAATAAAAPAADAQPGADVAAQQPSADMPPAEVAVKEEAAEDVPGSGAAVKAEPDQAAMDADVIAAELGLLEGEEAAAAAGVKRESEEPAQLGGDLKRVKVEQL